MVENTTWQMDQQYLDASSTVLRAYMDDNGASILLRIGRRWVPLLDVGEDRSEQQAWQGTIDGVCIEGSCPTTLYSFGGVEPGEVRVTREEDVDGLVLWFGSRAVLAIAGAAPKALPEGLLHLEGAELSTKLLGELACSPAGQSLVSLDVGGSEALSSSTTLDFLKPFRKLRGLDLSGFGHLENLEPLTRLAGLTHLGLEGCESLRNLEPLAALGKLESLELSNCTCVEDLSPLAKLTSLRSLDLSGCPRLKSLEPLCDLPALTELKLAGCKRLPELSPLVRVLSLTLLDLSGCESLESVTVLRACGSLEELWLTGSGKVHDVAALGGCSSLRILEHDDSALVARVLAACAVQRVDASFAREHVEGWLEALDDASDPQQFVLSVLPAIALGLPEPWALDAAEVLVDRASHRAPLDRDTWKTFFTTIEGHGEAEGRRVFEHAVKNLGPGTDPEPAVSAALEVLAEVPDSASGWARALADATLDALLTTPRAASVAASAVRYYAKSGRPGALESWLDVLGTRTAAPAPSASNPSPKEALPSLEDDPAALSGLIGRLVQKQPDSPAVAQLVAALAGLARHSPQAGAVERMLESVSKVVREQPDGVIAARFAEVFATTMEEQPGCVAADLLAGRIAKLMRERPEHLLTRRLGEAFVEALTEQPDAPAVRPVTDMIDAARAAGVGVFARRILEHRVLRERADAAELEAYVRGFDGRAARRAMIRGLVDTLCSEDILRNKPRNDVVAALEQELVDVD